MSDEYNVKLLVKQTKLNAKNALSHNEKYSGFKDLLKDNIPESLADYNGNAYDISSVFHDTNWSDNTKTPSTNSSQSNQKFSQIETNANLELYKNARLVPHEDASGTTHKLWTVYDDASNNLLEHMINYKFDNSGSYLPILTYHNGSSYVESSMFSDPLWWLIDYENHAISFFNTDSVLNGGTANISASSANPPKLTFYRYIGKTKVNNKLSVEGDISCNEVIVSGTTLTSKLGVIDLSYSDLSGVVTANIASIVANESNIASNATNISELDISYVDLSGVVTTNIASIATKAPIINPTFTSDLNINNNDGGLLIRTTDASYNRIKSEQGNSNDGKDLLITSGYSGGNAPDIYIKTYGNVGIGTTTPHAKCSVNGDIHINDKIILSYASQSDWWVPSATENTNFSYPAAIYTSKDNGGNSYPFNSHGHLILQPRLGLDIVFATGSTPASRMVIKNNGNVGIGTTTAMDNKLEIKGNVRIRKGNNDGNPTITFSEEYTSGSPNNDWQIKYFATDNSLRIGSINNTIASGNENVLVFDDNGNIGIGKTSPSSNLEVSSAGTHSSGWSNNLKLSLSNGNTGGAHLIESSNMSIGFHDGTKQIYFMLNGNGDDFRDNNWSSSVKMLIDSTGNVGIGTTSPGYPLEVSDYNTDNVSVSGYQIYKTGAGTFTSVNSTNISLKTSNNIWSEGAIFATSDQRIKENIHDVSDNDALQKLRDISCCFYEYKDKISKGNDKTIGFIAQQVKEHMPMAVSIKKDIIPDEMRQLSDYSWNQLPDSSGNYDSSNNQYKLTIHDLSDNSGNTLYRFYVSNDPSGNNEIKKEIKSMEDDPKSFVFDQSWNNVFLYGKEVDDLHILDKNKLFALNFSATQEIDRIQQSQQQIINDQQTTINTLQSTLAALEARIAALENP